MFIPWKIWLRKINTIVFDWNRIGGNYGKVAIYFHIGSCSIIIMTQNYDCCHENSHHNTNTDTNDDLFFRLLLHRTSGSTHSIKASRLLPADQAAHTAHHKSH